MTISELVESAQFLVDSEGNKKAVLLDFTTWEALLQLLDDLDDLTDTEAAAAAYESYRRDPSTAKPYNETRAEWVKEGLLDG
jgi:hypothetical protein